MSIISVIALNVIIGEGIRALFGNSSIARPLLPYAGIVVAFRIFIKHDGRFACILIAGFIRRSPFNLRKFP